MIEVLVAVFVLAAGLLGLASVQMQSIKNVNNAQFHTLATNYAYDMAERMRSNQDGLSSYAGMSTSSASATTCSSCSASEIAAYDIYQWKQQLELGVASGGLPTGVGTVEQNGSLYDITVTWDEQQRTSAGGSVGSASFTLSIQI